MICLIIITINLPHTAFSAPAPANQTGSEFGADLRVFKRLNKATIMAEAIQRQELESFTYARYSLGSYYRQFRNLKMGLFFWNELGNTYDEDWVKIDGRWQWKNTRNRAEQSLVLDLTPQTETPIENLIFEWKNRFVHNLSNGKDLLRTRPGLTYFVMKDDSPLFNLFLQFENYLPLNYGRKAIYDQWLYFGFLWHAHQNLLIGPYYAKRNRFWASPGHFSEKFGNEWTTEFKSNFYGLTLDFVF
jgi:hypothetical protein